MSNWGGDLNENKHTLSWKVPRTSKDLRRSFKLYASMTIGGKQEDYVPTNWRLQGSSQSWHAWNTSDLDSLLGRTIIVEYIVLQKQERKAVEDDPAWRGWYGDGNFTGTSREYALRIMGRKPGRR